MKKLKIQPKAYHFLEFMRHKLVKLKYFKPHTLLAILILISSHGYVAPEDSYNPGFDSSSENSRTIFSSSEDVINQKVKPAKLFDDQSEYDTSTLVMNFNRKKINNINNPSILSSLKKYGVYGLSLLFSSRVSNQIDNGIWYKAYLEEGLDAKNVIQQISVSGLCDVVELNYFYENEAISFPEVLDNPKINDQWYLENAGIQEAWQSLQQQGLNPGGAASVITAVIDTGVDYTHNDLISSMWTNPREIPNNGIDDDGNGFIDDIYGVNLVSDSRFHSGNPMDDHGHGTHVAGIIAAANNNVGIVGVAYNTKIMAIKAGNSSGYFLQTDIAEAIIYAYENGADVINMSFGGPTATTLVQDALSVAYTTSVLVAAAGNSALPNEGKKPMGVPFYPAAYPFVIGVMSSSRTNQQSKFTNFDVFSGTKIEYELFAPGEGITSTIPGNSYATWSGTSMAAPIVSGVAALLRTKYVNPSIYPNKFIISQIVSTAKVFGSLSNNKILSAIDSLNSIPQPSISIFDSFIMDGLDLSNKNNNDATVDAGETINIAVTLNNRWGMASEVVAELSILDTNHIIIINNSISYNSIGTYSLKDNGIVRNDGLIVGIANPFTFIVSDSAPNDFIINFNLKISYYNGLDTSDLTNYQVNRKLEFVISNGVELTGTIRTNTTLTKERFWIIPDSLIVADGVTLTVEPGTKIQFWSADPKNPYVDLPNASLSVRGKLIMKGTLEEPIEIFPSDLKPFYGIKILGTFDDLGVGNVEMEYVNIINPIGITGASYIKHVNFSQNGEHVLSRQLNWNGTQWQDQRNSVELRANIISNSTFYNVGGIYHKMELMTPILIHNVFIGCHMDVSVNNNTIVSYNLFYKNVKDGFFTSKFVSWSYPSPEETDINQVTNTTEKTYFAIEGFFWQKDALSEFAKSIGGHLVSINSQEEFNLITSHFNQADYVIGLDSIDEELLYWDTVTNEKATTNIFDFISFDQSVVLEQHQYYILSDNTIEISNGTPRMTYLIEIPNTFEGESIIWTKELLEEQISLSITNEGTHLGLATTFAYNSILNDVLNPDVTKWFRPDNYNGFSGTITYNYWGTANEDLVKLNMRQPSGSEAIQYSPFLDQPVEGIYPFVVSARILNSDGEEVTKVSNEQIKVVIEFNRDLDETVPLNVAFGSVLPYADYLIEGSYLSPRIWEGTTTLNTLIENGFQYLRITNGFLDSNPFIKLVNDSHRFMFEIDTVGALAMTMQGSANLDGISLNWFQDDFETLAGYNLYRSTSENGSYQKINTRLIPYGIETFLDSTVEPGVQYYYAFTVVKTDLTESNFSGNISIQSLDTISPNIYHTQVLTAFSGSKLHISATVMDNLSIVFVKLYYRIIGATTYEVIEMTNFNDKYSAIIDIVFITESGLEYYIVAYDGVNYSYGASDSNPYIVSVSNSTQIGQKGDVNGDGQITILDALMLLQAINSIIVLSPEQFERADLNNDGILSAAEALKIMQFVNGTISSIAQ